MPVASVVSRAEHGAPRVRPPFPGFIVTRLSPAISIIFPGIDWEFAGIDEPWRKSVRVVF